MRNPINRILCLSIAVSLPQVYAMAKEPSADDRKAAGSAKEVRAEHSLNPGALGRFEAILDFCTAQNGEASFKDKNQVASMVGEASESEAAEVRKSPEYRNSYDETNEALGNVPKDQAQEACRNLANDK